MSAPSVLLAGQDPNSARNAARLSRYRQYLDFYGGSQWEKRPLPGERRLTSNYARALVKKAVSYLFPDPVTFSVVQEGRQSARAEGRAAAAEALLAAVYDFNDLSSVDFDAAIDAAVLGDGAFKVTWDAVQRLPVVTPVDVQGLSVWWRADDVRRVTKVVQRTTMGLEEARERYPDVVLPAGSGAVALSEQWTDDRYTLSLGKQVVDEGANPFGWIPYVVFPNERQAGEFWGVSDLVDLIEPARELNRRLSVVSRVLELSGNPITVLENVEGAESIAVGPGAKWELPENSKAYLLDLLSGGGVRLHLDYIDLLYRVLHDLAETPRTAFGDSGRSLSGVALQVEIQPLIQKVKRKRRIWEGVYQRRNALCLDLLARLGGAPIGDLRRTVTRWGSILPSDRDALVNQEAKLYEGGLTSRRSALARLGEEDPETELALIASENQQQEQEGGGDGQGN